MTAVEICVLALLLAFCALRVGMGVSSTVMAATVHAAASIGLVPRPADAAGGSVRAAPPHDRSRSELAGNRRGRVAHRASPHRGSDARGTSGSGSAGTTRTAGRAAAGASGGRRGGSAGRTPRAAPQAGARAGAHRAGTAPAPPADPWTQAAPIQPGEAGPGSVGGNGSPQQLPAPQAVAGPDETVAPPDNVVPATPAFLRAKRSVVRIQGVSCGSFNRGSGWVAAPQTVVTNAHVVAGHAPADTFVQPGGTGPMYRAQVVAFNPERDLAVLHVPGLHLPALPIGSTPPRNSQGALLGYPLGGPYDERPARFGDTRERQVFESQNWVVSGAIMNVGTWAVHGNSGGPFVDENGRVTGTVFVSDLSTHAKALGVAMIRAELKDAKHSEVSTGACI